MKGSRNHDGTHRRTLSGGLLGVALGLILAGTGGLAAEAASKTIYAWAYAQEQSNWCWAATSATVVRWETGNTPGQCQLVKWGKAPSTCGNWTGSFGTDV